MSSTTKEFLQNRPALFDWMVFIVSFSMGFIYPGLGDFVISPAFSWWMFTTLVLYVAGTWLKHIPLSYRIRQTGKKKEIPYAIFLIAGHWCIILVVMIFAEVAVFKILGMRSVLDRNADNPWSIFSIMFLSGYVTWMVYRTKKLPKKFRKRSSQSLFIQELIADIFLVISVSILTFVIWEKGVLAMLGNKAVSSFSEVWFLFVMLSIFYLLLYLPLRYLYLIEDISSRQTWRRMLLIFAFLLLRSFIEIMRG